MEKAYYTPASAPEGFIAIIFATSYRSPFESLYEIELDLAARGLVGTVLLDMLLAHASVTHRYFAMRFDGAKLERRSEKILPTPELEAYSKREFKRCPVRLDKALLLGAAVRKLI